MAAQICEFPKGWQDTEIQLQLIEKGNLKRIRRQLSSKQHTLKEVSNIPRAQETADNQASRIESRQRSNEPINDEVNQLTKSHHLNDETNVHKMIVIAVGQYSHMREKEQGVLLLEKKMLIV